MDDDQIITLYWERSEQALTETAQKYGSYCYSIAFRILDNHEDAEESVNDTYIGAWHSMPPHRPVLLSAFLGKITRRVSIDRWRAHNAKKRGGGEIALVLEELHECIAADSDVEQEFDRQCLSDLVNTFVKSLPETEQKVFLRRYWYMDSVSSICDHFHFSESKVKSMLHRTRKKLRILLDKEGFQ